MEVNNQKSQAAKLTRTQSSSLLRSSPTVRSSIHSLSSVTEMIEQQDPDLDLDLEEQKPHAKPKPAVQPPHQTQSLSLAPVLAILSVSGYALYAFLTKHGQGLSTSENLLLSLTLVALLLFIVSRNKTLLNAAANQLCCRLRFCSKTGSEPAAVEWFIGETEKHDDRRPTTQKQGSSSGFKKINIREGVELYGNGDVYEGEFHKGRCNGSGVYSYLVNGRYEGDWIDGKYDGYGVESWVRGSRYRGQYRQGLRHGYGVYRFYTGDSYAGEWCNGQSHGVGVQTCADGSCYGGEFRSGVKHGIGCYHFRNGDRYAGEYFGDKIHGFGVYHFANGHYYEGSWHEGRKQGYGMYTFRNGEAKCGEWDGGNLKIALPTLTDAVLRAVQAARKTAENAIHLRRVDEQVNRAVMAANKAATAARVAAVKAVQNRIDGDFCDTNM